MQRAIEIHPRDNYDPFEIEVTEPGRLRRILTSAKPDKPTIIPSSMGHPVQAAMIEIPALLFEIDPSLKPRKRSFIWLPAGTKLTYPGKLEFRDSYVDEATGAPLLLYEVISTES